jgi:lysophospholipase L1-like esterase
MRLDSFEPDRIVIFLGTNYYDTPIELYDYKGAVEEFYKRLAELYPDTPVISITPLWRNNNVDWPRFMWCINTIKEACKPYKNVRIVDGFSLVPNVDECFADGVHPNAYGSVHLANNIKKILEK